MAEVQIIGLKEFEAAIEKNPQVVISKGKELIARSLAEATRLMGRSPWKIGDSGSGKGVPVSTGNLRQTHQKKIIGLTGIIKPTAKYAPYVHGIDGYQRKRNYPLRPWLDQTKIDMQEKLGELTQNFLKDITQELAK